VDLSSAFIRFTLHKHIHMCAHNKARKSRLDRGRRDHLMIPRKGDRSSRQVHAVLALGTLSISGRARIDTPFVDERRDCGGLSSIEKKATGESSPLWQSRQFRPKLLLCRLLSLIVSLSLRRQQYLASLIVHCGATVIRLSRPNIRKHNFHGN